MQKGRDLFTLVRDVCDGVVDGVDEENDLRGRIGGSLGFVEGENLLRLAVVKYGEVRLGKAGDWLAGTFGDGDVERDGVERLLCDERDRE